MELTHSKRGNVKLQRHFRMVTSQEAYQWLVHRENLVPGRRAGFSGPKGA